MNRALIFAEACNREASDNTLHVYHDGYVLTTACSPDRHRATLALLLMHFPAVEDARSDDGFLSAFVIPHEIVDESWHAFQWLAINGYKDHRHDDCDDIDSAADLLRMGLQR